jgi:hypothetical protein
MIEKRCSKCGEVKPVEQFGKRKERRSGYRSRCRECENRIAKEEHQKNPEIRRELARKWVRNNPEKVRENSRKQYKKNSEKHIKYAKEWYKNNLEKINVRRRKRRQENPEKYRECARELYRKNPEKYRKICKEWREKNLTKAKGLSAKTRIKYQEAWKEYFKLKYGDPKCQICEKSLEFFSGSLISSVYWDHRNGGNEIIKHSPSRWFGHPCNEQNISIWESCGFGILCNLCNFFLPTQNRELWLEKISQYIGGRLDERPTEQSIVSG